MKDNCLRRITMDKDDFISLIIANAEANESIGELILKLKNSNSKRVETYTHRQTPIDFTKVR